MRMHFDGEHFIDALNHVNQVMSFVGGACLATWKDGLAEDELVGLGNIITACQMTIQSVNPQATIRPSKDAYSRGHHDKEEDR